jgi:hypothetical protein
MDTFCFLFTFFVIVLTYLHYHRQFDCVEEICIYEIYYTNKHDLFLKCDIKQPILVHVTNDIIDEELFRMLHWDNLPSQYTANWCPFTDSYENSSPEYKRNIMSSALRTFQLRSGESVNVPLIHHEPTLSLVNSRADAEDDVVLTFPFSTAHEIMRYLPHYMTARNSMFLKETGMNNYYRDFGLYFKPNYIWNEEFDICYIHNENIVTPFHYHTSTYKFLCVLRGSIIVKMTEFHHCEQLKRYNKSISTLPSNIEIKEAIMYRNQILYIPPYCMYSILSHEPESCFCEFRYETIFNWLSKNTKNAVQMISQRTQTLCS